MFLDCRFCIYMPATEGSQRFAKQQLIILSSLSSAAAEHFFRVKIQTRRNKLPHYLFAARIEGARSRMIVGCFCGQGGSCTCHLPCKMESPKAQHSDSIWSNMERNPNPEHLRLAVN